ncbi:MAG TPA: ATP-binding protein [Candidatus Acidoferrum sp.]|nr:ATP-binding protein [Candidatus Acidoferrum sp.]
MVKLIVGKKGTGKTKMLVDMVNEAAKNSKGNVVCIEKDNSLTFDLKPEVRLIRADEYDVMDYTRFFGFLAGIMAADYDCTEIFIDSITKLCGKNPAEMEAFFKAVEELTEVHTATVFATISATLEEIPSALHPYIVNM